MPVYLPPIIRERATREPAQGLTEYGIILALVAVVAIAGLVAFGGGLGAELNSLLTNLGGSI